MSARRVPAMLLCALALGLVPAKAQARPEGSKDGQRSFDPTKLEDMDALAIRLKRHVAHLRIKVRAERGQPLLDTERDGFGVVIEPDLVAALAHLVDGATAIELHGPSGRLPAKVVLDDRERRVALLRTEVGLEKIGLAPAPLAAPHERTPEEDVFALISTDPSAGVLHGSLVELGELDEYEGHLRIDLELRSGMPVFDRFARLVGYSRVIAWDQDRFMLIPPEKIRESRTATGAAARPKRPKEEKHPWWSK